MSVAQGLIICFVILLGCIYGVLAILVEFIFHPILFFKRTKRTTPPNCMLDPTLGKHEYVHANGIKFHYVTCGDKSKPLMLLLHGFPEFWYSWRYQIKEFGHNYHVVAPDLRGYGETDKPPNILDYSLPNLCQDIVELIPALGHSKAILAAHDWGGGVAWAVASKHPDLVEKLIVMDCPHPQVMKKKHNAFFQVMKFCFFQVPCLPEFFVSVKDYSMFDECFRGKLHGVRNRQYFTAEDLEAYKYIFSQDGAFTPPINYYRAAFRVDPAAVKAMSKTIDVPTLVMWGDSDSYLEPSMADDHADVVTNLTVKHIPNCSHWAQNDNVEVVNQHMWEFLKEDD